MTVPASTEGRRSHAADAGPGGIAWERIFQAASNGIIVADQAGRIAFMNRQAGEIVKLDPEAVTGASIIGARRSTTTPVAWSMS